MAEEPEAARFTDAEIAAIREDAEFGGKAVIVAPLEGGPFGGGVASFPAANVEEFALTCGPGHKQVAVYRREEERGGSRVVYRFEGYRAAGDHAGG